MLLSEIEPIGNVGIKLLKEKNPKDVIDRIIESPLRNACKLFLEKGIETVMSSANRNNILLANQKPTEKEDVYGNGQQWFDPRPTFEDAGKGYSWIMINFDSLSDENKDLMFLIEGKTGKNGNKIGEKAIWFVHPIEIGNLDYKMKTGQYSHEFVRSVLTPEEMMPKDIEVDKRLAEFEKRHIVLSYNNRYPDNTVIIRMPVNENTTVDAVDKYFTEFAKCFKDQRKLEQLHKSPNTSQEKQNNQEEIEEKI